MRDDKIALVSGGNRGLGLEICRQLLAHGFRVLLGSRDLDAGIEAANALGSERVAAVRLDVTDAGDIAALAEHVDRIHGRLDVLVNNAGILIDAELGDPASIRDTDAEVLETTFRTNTVGPVMLINAMLPLLERVDDARIINMSSGMGQLSGMDGQYPGYRISKTALNAVTCIYAAELDPAREAVPHVVLGHLEVLVDQLAGQSDALVKPRQMRRGVGVDPPARALQPGAQHRQRRALAVGTRNMNDRRQRVLRIAQRVQEAPDPIECQIDDLGVQRHHPLQNKVGTRTGRNHGVGPRVRGARA